MREFPVELMDFFRTGNLLAALAFSVRVRVLAPLNDFGSPWRSGCLAIMRVRKDSPEAACFPFGIS